MRKILSIGLFLSAVLVVAPHAAGASTPCPDGVVDAEPYRVAGPEDPFAGVPIEHAAQAVGAAAFEPSELARAYGVALLVLVIPTSVLGWGIWRTTRQRAGAKLEV
jgi:hypothetical protein